MDVMLCFNILFDNKTIIIFYMKSNLVQQRARQRNITPNFLRFKRNTQQKSDKSNNPTARKDSGQKGIDTQQNTDRSSSRASRSSFEVYERRVLHLSKLKQNLNQNEKKQHTGPLYIKRTNYVTSDIAKVKTQTPSNQRNSRLERQNTHHQQFNIHKLQQTRKRTPSSGKNLLRSNNRTPSSSHRGTESSLEKQQENAKRVNAQLINTMMKNQITPNYINKVKQKKYQNRKNRNKSSQILNLNVPIYSEEQMEKYEVFGQLGKGAYGIVRMGVDKRTGQKIAIKIYQKKRIDQPNKIKNLQRQINILAQLNHSTIAKLLQVIQTQTQIYLILEYGGANSLYNYLLSKPQHRMQQTEAKKFILSISQSIQYLHRLDIVHRDIKAENILINRHKQLKIIDFGFSLRCLKNQTIDTFCGTPTYMAPEIVSKIDHCPVYTDMWSLGILYYVMLQGNYPFRAKNQNDLFQKIKKGQFEYIHNDISEKSKKVIQALLMVNPLQRMTIYDVLSKQNRQWLSGQNIQKSNNEGI